MRKGYVTQEDPYGCGIACVARVLGLTYTETRDLFNNGNIRAAVQPNFFCEELTEILNAKSKLYVWKYATKKAKTKIYRNGVIIFIRKTEKYPFGHYLVRYGNTWMDPWINMQDSKDIKEAKSGFRKRLPGSAQYILFPIS